MATLVNLSAYRRRRQAGAPAREDDRLAAERFVVRMGRLLTRSTASMLLLFVIAFLLA